MIKQTTKTRKPSEIQAPAVFRCTDKATGEVLGYLVPSDSKKGVICHVTYNHEANRYECDCECGEKHNHNMSCKHIRAVSEICKARRDLAIEALTEWMSGFAATLQLVSLEDVMAEAQAEMVQFDEEEDKEQIAAEAEAVNMRKLADLRATAAYEQVAAMKLDKKSNEPESCIYCGKLSKHIMCAVCAGV